EGATTSSLNPHGTSPRETTRPRHSTPPPSAAPGADGAPSLPTEARTTLGGQCVSGSVPPVLVRSCRCSRTPPRPHGSINTNEKGDKEKTDERSRAVRTGSGPRGAGTQGRRELDAHSRQRTAPLAGKSLAGAYRPSACARIA